MKTALVIAGKLSVGGAELICRHIGFFADPSRFSIDYLVFGAEIGEYEKELEDKGCRVFHWAEPGEDYIGYYRKLVRLFREKHYEIVHCHTMFNAGIVMRAASRCGVPVRIAHSHSIRGPEHRGAMKRLYEYVMRRWILRYATHYIGCGRAAGDWLFGERAFREKGILLLNGIDLERFRYSPAFRGEIRRKHHLEDNYVIGHAGHLATVKNQVFLLRLMPEILRVQPRAHLLLLGEGGDRAMLEQEIQTLNIEKSVTMTGNVGNVNEYLSAMDVFAFPSLYEGMPLSILEVQANGLPCVISDRVPRDVFLTDILYPLSLEDSQTKWVEALLRARRLAPERYMDIMQSTDADVYQMLKKIYQIYEGQAK